MGYTYNSRSFYFTKYVIARNAMEMSYKTLSPFLYCLKTIFNISFLNFYKIKSNKSKSLIIFLYY